MDLMLMGLAELALAMLWSLPRDGMCFSLCLYCGPPPGDDTASDQGVRSSAPVYSLITAAEVVDLNARISSMLQKDIVAVRYLRFVPVNQMTPACSLSTCRPNSPF